jgi:hypothetical protein
VQVDLPECGNGSCDRQALAGEKESDEYGEELVGPRPEPERREALLESQAAVVADEPVDAAFVVADTLQAFSELRERLVACR